MVLFFPRPRDLRIPALLLAMLVVCPPADGAGRGESRPTYALSVWTAETGLPVGEVLATTQDLDGYLWLGTIAGLVRFDGFEFVSWGSRGEPPLPGRFVTALAASRDGSLWVGFGAPRGGVARITKGKLVPFSGQPGAPSGSVATLLSDRQGRIWVGGRDGLLVYRNGTWTAMGQAEGFTPSNVNSLYEAPSDGALWVGAESGVYRGVDGVFEIVDRTATTVLGFTEDETGAIWITDTQDILRPLDRRAPLRAGDDVRMPASGSRLLRDRRDHIWVASIGSGLLRMSQQSGRGARLERIPYEHKIVGTPRTLFEDRDGNIWIGIRGGGLVRLSETSLTDVPIEGSTNDGVGAAATAADGSVWVATGYNLNRFANGRREVFDLAQTLSLYSDRSGVLWASTPDGLGRIGNGRFVLAASMPSVRWSRVGSVTIDQQGTMWICSAQQGVLTWDRQPSSDVRAVPELSRPCSVVYSDRHDRVWVGLLGGDVVLFDKGQRRHLTERDGLGSGRIMAVLEDKGGAIWVSTYSGISRYQDGRFVTMTEANGPIAALVPTLVEDRDGYLWVGVHSGAALMRFHPREMDKVAADRTRNIEYTLYDGVDGMQGALHWQSGVTGVRGGDGRLWFATGLGLVSVDPSNLPRPRRATAPRIESATADGRVLSREPGVVLPSGTSTIKIKYGTINLSAASKLRFRHSIVGNPQWTMGDATREVTYTNLPPGNHRFRVSATSDGQWTEAAVWEFTIAAPFYQQRWFYALIVLAGAASVGAAWGLRLRAVRRRYALVFAERARVSREIHDTLLQNLGAIGLELEAISMQLPAATSPAQDALRRLRRQVGHSLREARESIWELRHTSLETHGLVDSLQALADKTTATKGVPTTLTVTGRPQRSEGEVDMQLFRIAQEAVNNAIRHARATEIQITLTYDRDRAVLSVSDDGCGFTVEEHDAAPSAGEHLGLLSMRERAARIRGKFNIWSNPGHGTTIEAIGPLLAE